jgi:exodeoxyribonuclease III
VRLATWNVNSLKVRLPRVEAWLDEVRPDVLCLQETKLADTAWPALAFESMGYESAHRGQGQWNGVAVLSRVGIADVVADFDDGLPADPEARLLTATCGGVRVTSVYVPNGRSLDDDHYRYKLAWLERLESHLRATSAHDLAVVMGDFNIAPTDDDVYDAAKFVGATHVSAPEREALDRLLALGFHDVVRERHDGTGKIYSWWDYRAGDFHQGRGMRIDLVLTTPALTQAAEWAVIDRNARKGQQPSDHAPVVVDVDIDAAKAAAAAGASR